MDAVDRAGVLDPAGIVDRSLDPCYHLRTVDEFKRAVAEVAREAGLPFEEALDTVAVPRERDRADLALPCFRWAKALKKAPPAIAADVAAAFEPGEFLESAEATGPFVDPRLVVVQKGHDARVVAVADERLQDRSVEVLLPLCGLPRGVVEVARVNALFRSPKHPYTEALMSAVPIQNPRLRERRNRIRLEGEVADPSNPPSYCYFHPRCRYAQERCAKESPHLRDAGDGHMVSCHYAEDLALAGAQMMMEA